MRMCCDIEVDVNGQEIFMVDKTILSSFSGRLNKLFSKSVPAGKNLKVIFHDFPGGARGFELMARFCYNNGQIEINPSNISLLHCVAHFMEMSKQVSSDDNLIEHTEEFLEGITYWAWPEFFVALKQCQEFIPAAVSSGILQKLLDSLVTRLASGAIEASPIASPASSSFRFSSDSISTESFRYNYSRVNWWFEDFVTLNLYLTEKILRTMVTHKFDHVILSKFLFYYQKSRLSSARSSEKHKIIEVVVELLFLLDHNSVSWKSLFEILRVALRLNMKKSCQNKLEKMIGSQLHYVALDNLLIPSPPGAHYLYDVSLVLRFLKSFLSKGDCWASSTRLRKVASLMDLYIAEVAPDPCLKPSKFVALVTALPDSARDSYDGIYHAMHMYLEVHSKLSEEEKMNICCALNYAKLSLEALKHLAKNSKFPSRNAVARLSRYSNSDCLRSFGDSPCSFSEKGNKGKEDEKTMLYGRKSEFSMENETFGKQLKGMELRVSELEKVCGKMQIQVEKMMKSRLSSPSTARSLPKMCS